MFAVAHQPLLTGPHVIVQRPGVTRRQRPPQPQQRRGRRSTRACRCAAAGHGSPPHPVTAGRSKHLACCNADATMPTRCRPVSDSLPAPCRPALLQHPTCARAVVAWSTSPLQTPAAAAWPPAVTSYTTTWPPRSACVKTMLPNPNPNTPMCTGGHIYALGTVCAPGSLPCKPASCQRANQVILAS